MAMVLYALAFVWDLPHGKIRKVAELQTPASAPPVLLETLKQ